MFSRSYFLLPVRTYECMYVCRTPFFMCQMTYVAELVRLKRQSSALSNKYVLSI